MMMNNGATHMQGITRHSVNKDIMNKSRHTSRATHRREGAADTTHMNIHHRQRQATTTAAEDPKIIQAARTHHDERAILKVQVLVLMDAFAFNNNMNWNSNNKAPPRHSHPTRTPSQMHLSQMH